MVLCCCGKQENVDKPVTTAPPPFYRITNLGNLVRYNGKFGPMAVKTSIKVAYRRCKKGAKYPTWSYRAETFFEVLKEIVGTLKDLDLKLFLKVRPTWALSMPSNKRLVKVYTEVVEDFDDETGTIRSDNLVNVDELVRSLSSASVAYKIPKDLKEELSSLAPEIHPILVGEMTVPRQAKNRTVPPEYGDNIIYYLHGGAYVLCSAKMLRPITWKMSHYSGFKVFSLDYRMAPEYQFPAALEDAIRGYNFLINVKGYPSEKIHISGDSAGGGLSLALAFYLKDKGLPLPGSLCCFSPW